jgi:hypothetical protein
VNPDPGAAAVEEMNPDFAQVYADLNEALDAIVAKHPVIEKRRSYLEGTQPDLYDAVKWKDEFGPNIAQPRDNHCPTVVRTKTDLLNVRGFSVTAGDDTVAKAAAEIWTRNNMPVHEDKAHDDAVALASSYVMLGVTDKGKAVISLQKPEQVFIKFHPFEVDRAVWTLKVWTDGKRAYARLEYVDGRWFRFETKTDRWRNSLPKSSAHFTLIDQGEGVPAILTFELPNGGSDLDVMLSHQDQINLQVAEVMLIAHAAGWPLTVLSGVALAGSAAPSPERLQSLSELLTEEIDLVDGETLPPPIAPAPAPELTTGPNRYLTLEDYRAKASRLPAADISGPLSLLESTRAEVPRVTRRPSYLFGVGEAPSGKSLWEARSQLRSDVKRTQTMLGRAWANIVAHAIWLEAIHNEDGTLNTNALATAEVPVLETIWEPEAEAPLERSERIQTMLDLLNLPEALALHLMTQELDVSEEVAKALLKELAKVKEDEDTAFDRGLEAD